MKKSKVSFDKSATKKVMMTKLQEEQTRRFIAYAKEEVQEIAKDILSYTSANHMDRTGNLLDSLCWSVYFKGEQKEMGFYREPRATEVSYLHEWSTKNKIPVSGRELASKFLGTYRPKSGGWETIFAVLAPYWGYWEKGFTMHTGRFMQFSIMTQHYDKVKNDLKPCRTTFDVYVPSY